MLHLTYQSILSAFSISIPSIQQYSDINQLFRPQHKPFYKISPTLSSCSNNLMFCPCLGLLCSKQFFVYLTRLLSKRCQENKIPKFWLLSNRTPVCTPWRQPCKMSVILTAKHQILNMHLNKSQVRTRRQSTPELPQMAWLLPPHNAESNRDRIQLLMLTLTSSISLHQATCT